MGRSLAMPGWHVYWSHNIRTLCSGAHYALFLRKDSIRSLRTTSAALILYSPPFIFLLLKWMECFIAMHCACSHCFAGAIFFLIHSPLFRMASMRRMKRSHTAGCNSELFHTKWKRWNTLPVLCDKRLIATLKPKLRDKLHRAVSIREWLHFAPPSNFLYFYELWLENLKVSYFISVYSQNAHLFPWKKAKAVYRKIWIEMTFAASIATLRADGIWGEMGVAGLVQLFV